MDRSRADTILREWSSVARNARRPLSSPKPHKTWTALPAGLLAGATLVIVVVFAVGLGSRSNRTGGGGGPSASPAAVESAIPSSVPSPSATVVPSVGPSAVPSASTTSPALATTSATPGALSFSRTGSMATERQFQSATLLADGRVLVAGGKTADSWTSSAELYDPATGTFSATGSMTTPRAFHTATLLADGRVLIVGGNGLTSSYGMSAELYDPATGKFSLAGVGRGHTATPAPTDVGCSTNNCGTAFVPPLDGHTATLLADGRVLIAGGREGAGSVAAAEIYDPTSDTFAPTGSMTTPRAYQAAALLSNGEVLIVGGENVQASSDRTLASAELYDPATGTFSATGAMAAAREYETATRLADGRVLVAGGSQPTMSGSGTLSSAELYDPVSGAFSPAGSMTAARSDHSATLLDDGRVLIAGGDDSAQALSSAETFDPSTGKFTSSGSMTVARADQTATLLAVGRVLITGGDGGVPGATAELCHP